DRALRRGVRAGRRSRQARGLRELPRARFLRAAAQRREHHAAKGSVERAWRAPVRRADRGPSARGRAGRVAARGGMSPGSWKEALAAPMFEALQPSLSRLDAERFPQHENLNALASPAVASGGGAAIRFVLPAPVKEPAARYETRIFETGEVQTRPGSWHDLFNALVWLAFPKTKA